MPYLKGRNFICDVDSPALSRATVAAAARKQPLTISNTLGWSDTVVWNPYGDEGMGFDSFVCVESAQASSPVILQPSEYWTGAMSIKP